MWCATRRWFFVHPIQTTAMTTNREKPNADPIFKTTNPIFSNKDLLKIGHVPEADRIVGREEEIADLGKRLSDAIQGYSPEDIVVYGKTGTGKSLVVRHVTNRAKAAANADVTIGVAYIDCSEDNTETQAVSSLAMKLNNQDETGVSIPYHGISMSKYYKLLWKILDTRFDSAIIILDEVDMLKDDGILMKLSRAEESQKVECSVGIIAISNKIQYVESLDERVGSSFRARDLFFDPYDANQLREIMYNREEAFKEGVLTEDVIPLAAAFAAQEHGDARKAIDTLRHAGEIAYRADDTKVTEEHVRAAKKEAEKDRFKDLINGSPTQAKAVLLSLASLTIREEEDSFITSDVYDRYKQVCKITHIDILSGRRFRDILKEQVFLGVVEISKRNMGSGGGIHNVNRLVEDPEIVRDVLYEDTRMEDWFDQTDQP